MKGLYLLVFLVIAIVACPVSGTSTPETEVYVKTRDSDFYGERYGWLVLLDGRVLRTRDGGMIWEKTAAPPIPDNFSRLSFVNSEDGWAVSLKGKIWRSTDGGATWKNISSLSGASARESYVRRIKFIDKKTGFVLGAFDIWRTIDGGESWQPYRIGTTQNLGTGIPDSFSSIGTDYIWVSGWNSYVHKSFDGGRSWHSIKVLQGIDDADSPGAGDIVFLDQMIGFVALLPQGGLYKTINGGIAWRQILQASETGKYIQSICFLDENEGWVAGGDAISVVEKLSSMIRKQKGLVMHTVNGGRQWEKIEIADITPIQKIKFTDRKHGWIVARDSLYRSTDEGKHWHSVLKY